MPVSRNANTPLGARVIEAVLNDTGTGCSHLHEQSQASARLDGNDSPGIHCIADTQLPRVPAATSETRTADEPVDCPPQPPQYPRVEKVTPVSHRRKHIPQGVA